MPSSEQHLADSCRAGLQLLEAGRLDAARVRFDEVVAAWPDFVPALHALGVIARRQREPEAAHRYAARALTHAPNSGLTHVLMARVLCDLGRADEAITHYRMSVRLDETDLQARLELADTAARLGALAEAIMQYRAALALDPSDHAARRRLTLTLRRDGRLAEAEQLCRERLLLTPQDAQAPFDLGNILHDAEQFVDAVAAYRAALLLQPDHAGALENLGHTLMELDQLDEAEECLRQARAWHPELPGPQNGLGAVLRLRGRLAEAESCFRMALAHAPDDAEANCNLATTLLMTGRTDEGWRRFEARWGTRHLRPRGFAAPLWRGEPLAGQTLLLHAEQGLGDALQFCRFIDRVAGARLIVEVPAPLTRLIRQSFPQVAEVVERGSVLPHFDLHCPLMSLPLMLGIVGTAFADRPAYLAADPREQAAWSARLAAQPGKRIGLVWQGNPRLAAMRRRRDLPVRALAPLASVRGVSFVSLQKSMSDTARAERDGILPMVDWTDELSDLAATASLVAALDLVIGVDTAVAHLAGALGRPVWLLNRFDTCWRWMVGREDSPWYPSLRQFRQAAPGDWDGVMKAVMHNLN